MPAVILENETSRSHDSLCSSNQQTDPAQHRNHTLNLFVSTAQKKEQGQFIWLSLNVWFHYSCGALKDGIQEPCMTFPLIFKYFWSAIKRRSVVIVLRMPPTLLISMFHWNLTLRSDLIFKKVLPDKQTIRIICLIWKKNPTNKQKKPPHKQTKNIKLNPKRSKNKK